MLKEYNDENTMIEMTTTTNIRLTSKNGGGGGYLGKDPLNYFGGNNVGEMEVILPFYMGTATIKYNSIKVDGSNAGNYEVNYNGVSTTITPAEVHESVRSFI